MSARPDIAIISLGTTMGWRSGDQALADLIRAAGASCRVVTVSMGASAALRRTMALTDVVESLAAVRAARGVSAGATIFSSVTAALLQRPRGPHAVRFDATASLNRPGWGGAWQRRREPAVLARADLLLPFSEPARAAAAAAVGQGRVGGPPRQVLLPSPVERAREPAPDAPEVIAYAANPAKRGLDLLCRAWAIAPPRGARMLVGGIDREQALRWLGGQGVPVPAGVEWAGAVERGRWLALVAGAAVFVSAARFEDWGLAQMEALAAGTLLATVPTAGPNPALALARELCPALVAPTAAPEALATAVGAALAIDAPARAAYAAQAQRLLAPYSEAAVRQVVAQRVLPALLRH